MRTAMAKRDVQLVLKCPGGRPGSLRDRERADERWQYHRAVLRDLGDVGHEVLGVERHRDAGQHIAAGLLDEQLGLLVRALAPCVIGVDDRPYLAEILDAPGHAG